MAARFTSSRGIRILTRDPIRLQFSLVAGLTNGVTRTLVRAIDTDVATMIELAERASLVESNSTGSFVTFSSSESAANRSLKVIVPGGKWSLADKSGDPLRVSLSSGAEFQIPSDRESPYKLLLEFPEHDSRPKKIFQLNDFRGSRELVFPSFEVGINDDGRAFISYLKPLGTEFRYRSVDWQRDSDPLTA